MSAPAATAGGGEPELPRLRKSLKLDVIDDGSGMPALVISDLLSGKYFKLGWPLSGLFLLWGEARTKAELLAYMAHRYGETPGDDEYEQALKFAFKNELTEADEKGGWKTYQQTAKASRQSVVKRLAHNYLFFRIPLFRPDRMLARILPGLRFVFSGPFWIVIAALAAFGLYLTTRQWGAFASAFEDALKFQQLMLFAAALLALKAVHELGHALAAARYGCRVPSMGLAFMLGAPLLYTDTSDSWRLPNRRHRLNIVFAGVAAELIVAALALLAWPLLPDGPARDVTFSFATAAIVMTLAINLNPMMRFDGYFALSDWLDVPNLQSRAFALARWRLRETLFGLGAEAPELFEPWRHRTLLVYAYATWVYRFFLFLGIAYIIYLMAGKAIGIVLAVFELTVFIFQPIGRELRQWWLLRGDIRRTRRSMVTTAAVLTGLAILVLPCIRTVESPGVLVAADEQELHLDRPARLTRIGVREGQLVAAGDILFEAASPDLDRQLRRARLELRLLELRLRRLVASPIEHEQAVVIKGEYESARERLQGIEREQALLKITAPFAGRVVDLDAGLSTGIWVSEEHMLARLVNPAKSRVKAVVSDSDAQRIGLGASGVFIADEADLATLPVTLAAIAPASNGMLAEPALSDLHGGRVGSVSTDQGLAARAGWIEVSYTAEQTDAPRRLVRGVVRIEATPISPISLIWQQIGRVLVREQAF